MSMISDLNGSSSFPENFQERVDAIIQLITKGEEKGKAYDLLAYISDTFGPRMIGTDAYLMSAKELLQNMARDGFNNVQMQDVYNVTHWTRGEVEVLQMFEPRYIHKMEVMALGSSIGGSVEKAEVVVVENWKELDEKNVKGKIVLFNVAWDGYGNTVQYRSRGPSEAQKRGAVAALVRSVTPFSLYTAHTGMTNFEENQEKIISATITVEDSEMIARMVKRGQRVVLSMKFDCKNLQPTTSWNIVGEITGSKYPNEVIVAGGHWDSWDVGTGSVDDAGGVIVVYEAIKALIKLGLRPKRTIRVGK